MRKRWLILALVVLLGFTPLLATDYYVDYTDGLDTNNGTSAETAWKTITKVNAQMGSFNAGDNIYFQKGETWPTGEPDLAITCAGSSGSQITFGAYGTGSIPIFDNNAIQSNSGNGYITIDSIEVKNTTGDGIVFYKTSGWQYDIKITNCIVHDAGNVNIIIQSIDGYLIEDCTSYNGYNGNIYIYGSDYPITNGIIRGCTSYNATQNDGFGIHEGDSLEACGATHLIENCVGYGNAEESFDISNGTYVTVQDCEAYGDTSSSAIIEGDYCTFQRCNFHDGYFGIIIGASNATIRNCLIYDNTYVAFGIQSYVNVSNINIYHNTVVHPSSGNAGYVFYVDGTTGYTISTVNFKNNIFMTKQSTYPNELICFNGCTPATISCTMDYNVYYHGGGDTDRFMANTVKYNFAGWQSAFSHEAASQFDDPDFTDQDNDVYTLQSTSPCINEGTDVGLTEDYAGNPVGEHFVSPILRIIRRIILSVRNMPDIGAYEFWERR